MVEEQRQRFLFRCCCIQVLGLASWSLQGVHRVGACLNRRGLMSSSSCTGCTRSHDYVYMCVYIYIYIYTYMSRHIYMYNTYTHVYICMSTCTSIYFYSKICDSKNQGLQPGSKRTKRTACRLLACLCGFLNSAQGKARDRTSGWLWLNLRGRTEISQKHGSNSHYFVALEIQVIFSHRWD